MKSLWTLLFILGSAHAQIVLQESKVVNQGSLGICASASTAVLLEAQGSGEASYLDIAITDSFAKGALFDLQGSTPSSLISSIGRLGFCPRALSWYENKKDQEEIVSSLHAQLIKLVRTSSSFLPHEKERLLVSREAVKEAMREFQSPAGPRRLIKNSAFILYLYQGAKGSPEALEWVDGFADYQYQVSLEESQPANVVIKIIAEMLYEGSAWEEWLKKNVIRSPLALNHIKNDLARKQLVLDELMAFSQEIINRDRGVPQTFSGELAGTRPEVVKWIHDFNQLVETYTLTDSQTAAALELLTVEMPELGSPAFYEYRLKVLDQLRAFFRVGCSMDSFERVPVTLLNKDVLEMKKVISRERNWQNVFARIRNDIQTSLNHGLPVAVSYDVDHALKVKSLLPLDAIKGPTGFLHASVIVGLRETSSSTEYLIQNSYGTSCEGYYDPSKCQSGKIWVAQERLIPYTETLNFFVK